MSTLQDLQTNTVLRTLTDPDLVTVNRELTFPEGDNFRIFVYNLFKTINSGAGVAPYNSGTAYTGTTYVSYGGNIWVHVSASPSTAITPGTNGLIWELTSIGVLAHQQNTDQYLDAGGLYETAVQDLWSLVNEQIFIVTEAAFDAQLVASTLVPNRRYRITDGLFPHSLLHIRSENIALIDSHAMLATKMPLYSATSGLWVSGGAVVINSYYINIGYVFRNVTGTNTTTPPSADAVNWSAEDPGTSSKYSYQHLNCEIGVVGGGLVFFIGTDFFNNTYAFVNMLVRDFATSSLHMNNKCDVNSTMIGIFDILGEGANSNTLWYSSVICDKGGNSQGDGLGFNNFILSELSFIEVMLGEFSYNVLTKTRLVFSGGLSSTKYVRYCNFTFANSTILVVRSSATLINGVVNDSGSNLEDTIVMSGLTTINLTTNGSADVYGVIIASSVNATETINLITNGARLFPIKINPESGLTLTVTATAHGSVSAHGQIIGAAASYILNGTKGDYLILEPAIAGAFSVYKVKQSSITL